VEKNRNFFPIQNPSFQKKELLTWIFITPKKYYGKDEKISRKNIRYIILFQILNVAALIITDLVGTRLHKQLANAVSRDLHKSPSYSPQPYYIPFLGWKK